MNWICLNKLLKVGIGMCPKSILRLGDTKHITRYPIVWINFIDARIFEHRCVRVLRYFPHVLVSCKNTLICFCRYRFSARKTDLSTWTYLLDRSNTNLFLCLDTQNDRKCRVMWFLIIWFAETRFASFGGAIRTGSATTVSQHHVRGVGTAAWIGFA
jgi:hypothetical protein